MPVWPILAACLLGAALSGLIVWVGPKDAPDGGRKMQVRPVPTSGGAAVLVSAITVFGALLVGASSNLNDVMTGLQAWGWIPHVVLVVGAAVIGLIDDARGLSVRPKMALLAALSLFAAAFGFHVAPFGDGSFGHALGIAGSALWLFVIMNVVNFMDGCNGLAGGCLAALFVLVAAIVGGAGIGAASAPIVLITGLLVLAAALGGFLVWNIAGRLYLGDAGALSLGAAFGSSVLFLDPLLRQGDSHSGVRYVWLAGILALPLLIDVFMTLIWRSRRGENILNAHREHAYQLFMRAGWPHLVVSGVWVGLTLVCGTIGYWAVGQGVLTSASAFAVLLVLGISLWLLQRRIYWPKASRRG